MMSFASVKATQRALPMDALPALYGGTPVRRSLLPYGHHEVTKQDIQAVIDVLRSE
ncbi:MAG: hypothetical protein HYT88_01870 [Candidatus Omnitrophica bacterium]|nr:hypothetical protein [Candidatus Omnitrophota bacterium]MBI3010590.1 hypothetical protein [Candidatus Omnitrophota bacterium]